MVENLDKNTEERIKFIADNYNQLIVYHLDNPKKIYLGSKRNRICRFCGKSSPEVTFKSAAHAIPEFTNNKNLIANYECDQCNNKFSSLLESHMAHFMNLYHTLSQVIGKKGVPSFRTIHQKKSKIKIGNQYLEIEDHVEDSIARIDEDAKTITFESIRASYIPIAIYKCLVKMALTIMPEEEIDKFGDVLEWISEEKHGESKYNLSPLPIFFSFAPGIRPLKFTSCLLFKRKPNAINNVPHILFVLAYGNFVFQVHIPMCEEDKELIGKKLEIVHVPSPVDMLNGSNSVNRQVLDMSSKIIRKGDVARVVMQFESFELLPPENTSDVI